MDCATKFFGIEVLTKRKDITKLDEEDTEVGKWINSKTVKHFLECDLLQASTSKVIDGIMAVLWANSAFRGEETVA